MTSFSFFKYFDAFELDVSVVNFVYYGKTRMIFSKKAKFTELPAACDRFSLVCLTNNYLEP